jgi:hypothetical protein
MASHGIGWVPGAHMRFMSLDFTITAKELARAPAPIHSPSSASLGAVVEVLEELQLCSPEVRAPGSDQLLDLNSGRLER